MPECALLAAWSFRSPLAPSILAHSPTHSLTHSLARSLTHSLTHHSLTHSYLDRVVPLQVRPTCRQQRPELVEVHHLPERHQLHGHRVRGQVQAFYDDKEGSSERARTDRPTTMMRTLHVIITKHKKRSLAFPPAVRCAGCTRACVQQLCAATTSSRHPL